MMTRVLCLFAVLCFGSQVFASEEWKLRFKIRGKNVEPKKEGQVVGEDFYTVTVKGTFEDASREAESLAGSRQSFPCEVQRTIPFRSSAFTSSTRTTCDGTLTNKYHIIPANIPQANPVCSMGFPNSQVPSCEELMKKISRYNGEF